MAEVVPPKAAELFRRNSVRRLSLTSMGSSGSFSGSLPPTPDAAAAGSNNTAAADGAASPSGNNANLPQQSADALLPLKRSSAPPELPSSGSNGCGSGGVSPGKMELPPGLNGGESFASTSTSTSSSSGSSADGAAASVVPVSHLEAVAAKAADARPHQPQSSNATPATATALMPPENRNAGLNPNNNNSDQASSSGAPPPPRAKAACCTTQ